MNSPTDGQTDRPVTKVLKMATLNALTNGPTDQPTGDESPKSSVLFHNSECTDQPTDRPSNQPVTQVLKAAWCFTTLNALTNGHTDQPMDRLTNWPVTKVLKAACCSATLNAFLRDPKAEVRRTAPPSSSLCTSSPVRARTKYFDTINCYRE